MSKVVIVSHEKEFNRQLRNATSTGLKAAAVFYWAEARKSVTVANEGTRRRRKRKTAGGKKGSQYTTYDNSSKPGEPPRQRTGIGLSHIRHEYNGNKKDPAVRVGVTKKGLYMFFLEVGTRTIRPRPWLMATLKKHWREIGRLAAIGGRNRVE